MIHVLILCEIEKIRLLLFLSQIIIFLLSFNCFVFFYIFFGFLQIYKTLVTIFYSTLLYLVQFFFSLQMFNDVIKISVWASMTTESRFLVLNSKVWNFGCHYFNLFSRIRYLLFHPVGSYNQPSNFVASTSIASSYL